MIEKYINASAEQIALIEKFYQIHLNATLNLTAIKDRESFYIKHVIDSFLLYTELPKVLKGRVADIGTGGGFPGVVLAILYPEIKMTLIDSIAKKCRFLEEAVAELGLKNVEVITSRCENVKNRKFDTILSRGVAKVDQMVKFTINLADKNCVWVLYKGENADEELKAAADILKKQKLEYANVRYDEPIQRTYTILYCNDNADRLYSADQN